MSAAVDSDFLAFRSAIEFAVQASRAAFSVEGAAWRRQWASSLALVGLRCGGAGESASAVAGGMGERRRNVCSRRGAGRSPPFCFPARPKTGEEHRAPRGHATDWTPSPRAPPAWRQRQTRFSTGLLDGKPSTCAWSSAYRSAHPLTRRVGGGHGQCSTARRNQN